jgi:flagellin
MRSMGLSLASNIASLSAQTKLRRTTDQLSDTFARLSSGLRINNASDDPAGLAMADSLRSDGRLAAVAIRNANDGLSLASIADSALEEVGSILSRMSELASQSANGTYTTSQRSALSSEFLALGSEVERISQTTTFNGFNLLSASSTITLQVGFNANATSQISMLSVLGTLSSLGLASSGSSRMTFSIIDTTTTGSQAAALTAMSAVSNALTSLSSVRGTIGATQSRLSSAVNYLQVARENLIAAESRIRDADIASDVAEMVRLQVLQQSGTAILAQANQQPGIVLSLLN